MSARVPTRLGPGPLALDPRVAVPTYDRTRLVPGVVHVGVGGFHRAHQAVYLDDLANRGLSDWGICGVGVLPADRAMAQVLRRQDHLYTLVVKHPDGRREARVIGSILDYLLAPEDPAAVVERMAAPTTRIVSLTVTEGGYNIDPVTGAFDHTNAALLADATAREPSTAFGLITAALERRRAAGQAPFTVMSCDNLPGNGDVARTALVAFAAVRDEALARWIEAEVSFPNAMVDRITPVTTDADRQDLAEEFGVLDAWPVVCEPFRMWALEDRFGQGRPPLEEAGALLVADVQPYELMKLRLLNGAHQALAHAGRLLGYTSAADAARDVDMAAYLRRYMVREAAPTLPEVPGVDLDAYERQLVERFANPQIGDTIERLAAWTSDRIPTWIVPIVAENLRADWEIDTCATLIAAWARYCEGTDEAGKPIEVVDRAKDERTAAARRWPEDRLAFVRNRQLFADLAENPRFADAYVAALDSLHIHGTRRTLQALTARTTATRELSVSR